MTKVEHPLEDCIGMHHHGSNAGYSEIHAYTLNGKRMSPYRSVHCAVYFHEFRAEISPIPVTYDSWKNRKESGKFAHVSTMKKLTRMILTMLKERKECKYESPALTQSKISKLEVA